MINLAIKGKSRTLNKFLLERALLDFSIKKEIGYLMKCKKINSILNDVVEKEIRSGRYQKHVTLKPEQYSEIFG